MHRFGSRFRPGDEGPAVGGPGFAKLNIDFFESGGTFSTPISLKKVGISVQDIDSEQYVAFKNISSYSLSSDPESVLTVTENGSTTTIAETNDISSSADDEEHWVAVRFTETSSITFTVGSLQSGDAQFRMSFTLPEWSVEPEDSTPSEETSEEASLASTGTNDTPVTLGALGFALLLSGGAALAIVRRSHAS